MFHLACKSYDYSVGFCLTPYPQCLGQCPTHGQQSLNVDQKISANNEFNILLCNLPLNLLYKIAAIMNLDFLFTGY